MNFFLDHDVPVEIGRVLRLKGHNSQFLDELLPRTTDDRSALHFATARDWVVLTCNRRDFLHLAKTEPHAGIVILVRRRTRTTECAALLRLIERAGENGIRKNINFA